MFVYSIFRMSITTNVKKQNFHLQKLDNPISCSIHNYLYMIGNIQQEVEYIFRWDQLDSLLQLSVVFLISINLHTEKNVKLCFSVKSPSQTEITSNKCLKIFHFQCLFNLFRCLVIVF